MNRRALIIYSDNTDSGYLAGPSKDGDNLIEYLTCSLGGHWYEREILLLSNPNWQEVIAVINSSFVEDADYTFIVFSGHGYINAENNQQYIELSNGDLGIRKLITPAPRQTLIIDSCRGYYTPSIDEAIKGFSGSIAYYSGRKSTRSLFEKAVMRSERGLSILFAADEDESAADSDEGGAYLLSLLRSAERWSESSDKNILPLNIAHRIAVRYMRNNFETIQNPSMNKEKRRRNFPFAVKL